MDRMRLLLLLLGWLCHWRLLAGAAGDSFSTADDDGGGVMSVYPPFLPEYIAANDKIDDLELRVYLPSTDEASLHSVHVIPTSDTITFTPSSFLFDATQVVAHFSMETSKPGTWTIDFLVSSS